MIDVNQIMYDLIKRSGTVETTSVEEIEEIVDTGLEINDDNVQKAATDYLTEKGYARTPQNMDMAKRTVMESSEGSDTVRVRRVRTIVENLLSDMDEKDAANMMNICLLDQLMKVSEKMDTLTNQRYEYAVEIVDEVLLDSEKPQGSLVEFISFQTLLNRYASQGFRVVGFTIREIGNHGKIMMSGFQSMQKQTVVVFERQVV
ncbi:MAG: DUF4177 domain-containing protein [Lachnospiraceae bacterium]|nr:DUF4177 domain-containing protein [Lachnospiraceae bacterium]